eukprot:760511-Hanusia_phi.AAC.3
MFVDLGSRKFSSNVPLRLVAKSRGRKLSWITRCRGALLVRTGMDVALPFLTLFLGEFVVDIDTACPFFAGRTSGRRRV